MLDKACGKIIIQYYAHTGRLVTVAKYDYASAKCLIELLHSMHINPCTVWPPKCE